MKIVSLGIFRAFDIDSPRQYPEGPRVSQIHGCRHREGITAFQKGPSPRQPATGTITAGAAVPYDCSYGRTRS